MCILVGDLVYSYRSIVNCDCELSIAIRIKTEVDNKYDDDDDDERHSLVNSLVRAGPVRLGERRNGARKRNKS